MEGAPKQADRVNIVAVIVIGMIGALVVYASFTALQAFYNAEAEELETLRNAEGKSHELRAVQARQLEEMSGYRMLDKRNQIVSLPIEQAMRLVIADVRSGKPTNLVPAVGPHDTPTVPVVNTQPEDTPPPMEQPTTPSEGATPGAAPAGNPGAAPAGNPGAAPAGASPNPGGDATP